MYMPSSPIEVKLVDQTGTIILNRPDKQNALTRQMVVDLTEALDDLYYEKQVRAIVLTGAGPAFSVGVDLAESKAVAEEDSSAEQWGVEASQLCDLLVRMLEITKPIIAAVNGPALSFGVGLVAAADIVIASTDASAGLPDARYGLVAGLATPLLNYRIGAGQTGRLLLTGNTIDAAEAERLGLFHELIDADRVWARAMQVAAECACCAPEATQLSKRLLNETLGERLATQLSAGAVMHATSRTTEAAAEGIAAQLEGRKPEWRGR